MFRWSSRHIKIREAAWCIHQRTSLWGSCARFSEIYQAWNCLQPQNKVDFGIVQHYGEWLAETSAIASGRQKAIILDHCPSSSDDWKTFRRTQFLVVSYFIKKFKRIQTKFHRQRMLKNINGSHFRLLFNSWRGQDKGSYSDARVYHNITSKYCSNSSKSWWKSQVEQLLLSRDDKGRHHDTYFLHSPERPRV